MRHPDPTGGASSPPAGRPLHARSAAPTRALYRAVVPLLIVGIAGCREMNTIAGPARLPSRPSLMVAIDSNEATWDYFAATETISRDAGQNSAGMTNATTQTVYSIQRTLGSNNVWSTSNSYNALPAMDDSGTPAPSRVNVAQLSTDDAGNSLSITAGDGSASSPIPDLTQTYSIEPPPPGRNPMPLFPNPPAGWTGARVGAGVGMSSALRSGDLVPRNASMSTLARGVRQDPRAWLANFVVTNKNRVVRAAARQRYFGVKTGVVGALDRYVAHHDSVTIEDLVDPNIGAAVERNLVVNGRLRVHMTRSYADVGDGRFVLASVEFDVAQGNSGHPRITKVSFDNVTIERR